MRGAVIVSDGHTRDTIWHKRSPTPTEPRAGQTLAAEEACKERGTRSWQLNVMLFREMRRREQRAGHPSIHPPPGFGGAWRTILTKTRSPYTLMMLTNGAGDAHCLIGPGSSQVTGVDMQSPSGARVRVGPGRLAGLSLGFTRASNGKPSNTCRAAPVAASGR